jgi:hypothetical protein
MTTTGYFGLRLPSGMEVVELALTLHDFRRLRARRLYGWRSFKTRRGSA